MLPSMAKPTRGSMTAATSRDSMITTMPRRPRPGLENLPLINPRAAHVTSPRKIGRTEVGLGQISDLASRQGDQAAEPRRAGGGGGEVVRGWDIPAGADHAGAGSPERAGKQAGISDYNSLNEHVLAQVRTTGTVASQSAGGALQRIDVFHRREDKDAVAAGGGDVLSGGQQQKKILVPGLGEVEAGAIQASRIAADFLHLQCPDQVQTY